MMRGRRSTDDYFDWSTSGNYLVTNDNKGPVCGYMHQQYWTAVKYLMDEAWRNADSWGVFGYYVLYGCLPPELPRNPDWPPHFNPNFTPRISQQQHSSFHVPQSGSVPAWVADWSRQGKITYGGVAHPLPLDPNFHSSQGGPAYHDSHHYTPQYTND
ncbi:hypothetical protein CVT24_007249 [Panaeolus cyanescens]|uniref:Uncharacterized protein n=1 Tax=Panaeolus cyanescens TaxID=181874 RepID=A0A409YWF5_9AGAR|nr:hypothetical protein CVT24_007249 [Panaeolus cyanescens]